MATQQQFQKTTLGDALTTGMGVVLTGFETGISEMIKHGDDVIRLGGALPIGHQLAQFQMFAMTAIANGALNYDKTKSDALRNAAVDLVIDFGATALATGVAEGALALGVAGLAAAGVVVTAPGWLAAAIGVGAVALAGTVDQFAFDGAGKEYLREHFKMGTDALGLWIAENADAAGTLIENGWNKTISTVSDAAARLQAAIDGAPADVAAAWEAFKTDVSGAFDGARNAIDDFLTGNETIGDLRDIVDEAIALGNNGIDSIDDFFDGVGRAGSDLLDRFADTVGGIGDWLDNAGDDFSAAIRAQLRRLLDPIVLDLDGDGIELAPRKANGVYFDMDGDGIKELTGWVAKDDGLLAIDENGNGQIDSIVELIGDLGRSGFAELLTYDGNGDKVIDSSDAVFSQLRVWQDANSNGLTDAGELRTMAQVGVKSVDLKFTTVNFTAEGNRIHEQSQFEFTNGTTGTVADAWFDVSNVDALSTHGLTGNDTVDSLPDIPGYGDVSSLRAAANADGALTSLIVNVIGRDLTTMDGIRSSIEQILFRWAGTAAVATDSRGVNFDGRQLATLEKFLGTTFVVNGSGTPLPASVAALTQSWTDLVGGVAARLLMAGSFGDLLADKAIYASYVDRIASTESSADILAALKAAQPTGTTVGIMEYWTAALVVARQIAQDSGVDTSQPAYQNAVRDILADTGLGNIVALLSGPVLPLPTGGAPTANGIYMGTAGADAARLSGLSQAVYGLGGDDQLIATNRNGAARIFLDGGAGDDILQGSAGIDWLDGGTGNDIMAGGFGDDTYVVDSGDDLVIEALNAGLDTVRASIDYVLAEELNNLALIGSASLNGTGNATANMLIGNDGANVLRGLDGNDLLDGGKGNDTLYGGLGDDIYVIGATGDRVIEQGDGYDIVRSSITHVLGAKLERLELIGSAAINGTGNGGNNEIVGNSAVNRLDGGEGADRMTGGAGDDVYVVDNRSDRTTELADDGIDTVQSSISLQLEANIEKLLLTGTLDTEGFGNALDNALTGNGGNNRLDGGAGADQMAGGLGDDIYVVDNVRDRVTEGVNAGTDWVFTSMTQSLGNNVENLQLYSGSSADSVARNGTGNALNNIIRGNDGANFIRGLNGDDSLSGERGDDRLDGGAGNDVLDGGIGNDRMTGDIGDDIFIVDATGDEVIEALDGGTDTIRASISIALAGNVENLELTGRLAINGSGNDLDNRIFGNDSTNLIDGGAGSDAMAGGGGDDEYGVDRTSDTVIEGVNAGYDTVVTLVDFTLGSNVENLRMAGAAALAGTGNTLANNIFGNDGSNVIRGLDGHDYLDGGKGADFLYGGLGDDIFVVDSTGDRIFEEGAGTDTVNSYIDYTLDDRVERLELLGTINIDGTGNQLNNIIFGNAGLNVLDGSLGDDRMYGGAGNDIYIVDSRNDAVYEDATGGVDRVNASVSYNLSSYIENLTLTGAADIDASGNDGDNSITGNAGDNYIDGRGGADLMRGGIGDDTYVIGEVGDRALEYADAGTDTIVTALMTYTLGSYVENLRLYVNNVDSIARSATGNTLNNQIVGTNGVNVLKGMDGHDRLFGLDGADTLEGGDGDDLLDGGLGDDRMTGGLGNDIYVLSSAGDVITEAANGGTDTVRTSFSTILAGNIENLELTGTASIDGQGNGLANRLVGNSGNNGLDGGAGRDIMIGGYGDDTYTIDSTADVVIEAPDGGTDTVRSTVHHSLGIGFENLVMLGTGNLRSVGNELRNTITGNAGANQITGGYEGDTMTGGGGADRFIYKGISESDGAAGYIDFITDFSLADGDRIDIASLDGNTAVAGFQDFTLMSGTQFTGPGQIIARSAGNGSYRIYFNDDADSSWDMQIYVTSATAPVADWFIY